MTLCVLVSVFFKFYPPIDIHHAQPVLESGTYADQQVYVPGTVSFIHHQFSFFVFKSLQPPTSSWWVIEKVPNQYQNYIQLLVAAYQVCK